MELPITFEQNMRTLLKDDYDSYAACLEQPMHHGIRINTMKISVEEFLKINPFHLRPVPWCENGFYYDETLDKPSKHPYYFAGLYYIQEPSAMTPAHVLPVEAGDRVLDICAAPGGKSTELAAKLHGTGLLVSNDISASRAKALLKNLEVFGAENALIISEAPYKLAERFHEYFDKILIDAPCSGEGMFRKSASMITAWENNGNQLFADLQRSILDQVVTMLKPGGMLLYSTCTFAPLENEQSIEYLLSLDDRLELVDFHPYEGFDHGHPEWGNTGSAAPDSGRIRSKAKDILYALSRSRAIGITAPIMAIIRSSAQSCRIPSPNFYHIRRTNFIRNGLKSQAINYTTYQKASQQSADSGSYGVACMSARSRRTASNRASHLQWRLQRKNLITVSIFLRMMQRSSNT